MSNNNCLNQNGRDARLDEGDPDQLWSERKTADYLGLAPKTLRQWRCRDGLLPFIRLGGRLIRYRRADVEAFVNRGARFSTSHSGDVR